MKGGGEREQEREVKQEKGGKWGKNVAVKDFVALASCCCFYDQYFFGGVAWSPPTPSSFATSTFCCSPDCARQCAAALFKDEAQQ